MSLDSDDPPNRLPAAEHRPKSLGVELTPDGRLKASRTARHLLRTRLRHAEMMPTTSEWVVLRNIAPAPSSSEDGAVVVAAGSIAPQGLSLVDLIGFLESGQNTGTLVVTSETEERSISFRNGNVVAADSSIEYERPNASLSSWFMGTEVELDDKRREELHEYVRDILDGMLSTSQGMWSFSHVPESLLPTHMIASTQGLLMDALRRQDEMQVYRQRIKSTDVRIEQLSLGLENGARQIDPQVAQIAEGILPHLDRPTTIYELMAKLGQNEFELTRDVYHLIRADLVRVVTEQTSRAWAMTPPLSVAEAREIIQVYVLGIKEVFEEIQRRGGTVQLRAAVEEYLAVEAGSGVFAQIFRNVVIGPEGEMDVQTLVLALSRNPLSAKELNEALGELLFFVLFQATEYLGRRHGDELARRVRMIHEMLEQPPSSASETEDL